MENFQNAVDTLVVGLGDKHNNNQLEEHPDELNPKIKEGFEKEIEQDIETVIDQRIEELRPDEFYCCYPSHHQDHETSKNFT